MSICRQAEAVRSSTSSTPSLSGAGGLREKIRLFCKAIVYAVCSIGQLMLVHARDA